MSDQRRTPRRAPRLPPPELKQRWFHARREERAVRWLRRGVPVLLLVATAAVLSNWWLGRALLTGREEALAAACADSPFASGSVLAAGGAEVIDVPDHPALDPYRGDPPGRSAAALRIRDHAALLDEPALAAAAVSITRSGPFVTVEDIARVEAGCARYLPLLDR